MHLVSQVAPLLADGYVSLPEHAGLELGLAAPSLQQYDGLNMDKFANKSSASTDLHTVTVDTKVVVRRGSLRTIITSKAKRWPGPWCKQWVLLIKYVAHLPSHQLHTRMQQSPVLTKARRARQHLEQSRYSRAAILPLGNESTQLPPSPGAFT